MAQLEKVNLQHNLIGEFANLGKFYSLQLFEVIINDNGQQFTAFILHTTWHEVIRDLDSTANLVFDAYFDDVAKLLPLITGGLLFAFANLNNGHVTAGPALEEFGRRTTSEVIPEQLVTGIYHDSLRQIIPDASPKQFRDLQRERRNIDLLPAQTLLELLAGISRMSSALSSRSSREHKKIFGLLTELKNDVSLAISPRLP